MLEHLDRKLDFKSGYPEEPTWGYAFSYLLALELNTHAKSKAMEKKSLHHYLAQSKPQKTYSWEFTVYAMQRAVKVHRVSDDTVKLDEYNEKGTRMVNWTLLRQLNRMNAGLSYFKSKSIILAVQKIFTTKQGQVLDELKTRSYQYHCFCLFIIAELYDQYPSESLKNWLLDGCRFIEEQAMESGVALYIGRGQEQIFGYGALIYALSFAQERLGYKSNGPFLKIWNHLKSFQRQDGSFPLVLNKCQSEKSDVSYQGDHPSGWYGYNTLYDYQPFLAYCLARASKL
jgi:hypothetical protein